MTFDIVDYPEQVYKGLTTYQYYKIELAQSRKDALLEELEEEIQKMRQSLIQKGTYASNLFEKLRDKLREKYEGKIDLVKKEIIAYLGNTMRPSHLKDYDAPYVLNYALSQKQRFEVVKEYFYTTYTDPNERLEAFSADDILPDYIEDYYEYLYDLIARGL